MNVVFDIGNVLIRWDPHRAFDHLFDREDEIAAFLAHTRFHDWNAEQDRGRSREDAIAWHRDRHPEHVAAMAAYFDRFPRTIAQKIDGTWDIARRLKATGTRIFALTNWASQTWPDALRMHPELEMFEDIVVSGHENLIKPEPAIYAVLTDRNALDPASCLFIDDSEKNVTGARNVGWQAHHFTEGPEGLERDLTRRGLL